MHDTEFFKKLVENIVMWSFVIVIAALALTIYPRTAAVSRADCGLEIRADLSAVSRRADGDGRAGSIEGW